MIVKTIRIRSCVKCTTSITGQLKLQKLNNKPQIMTKNLVTCIFSILILSSCGKFSGNATVIRDCTGEYLRIDNRDYLICNPSKVNEYENGSSIEVKYDMLDECVSDPYNAVCFMYHESHGAIQITSIK